MLRSFRIILIGLYLTVLVHPVSAGIIQAGDVIEISVVDHPEFSGKFPVNDKGIIEYPLLADHSVANTNTTELMQELTYLLARHIDNPLVMVSIVTNPEITVSVLGQVNKPGTITLLEGASVQEAIVAAGGPVAEKADLRKIRVIYHDRTRRGELFNLEEFLAEGTVDRMPVLSNGDAVVVLTQEKSRSVKVIGAVQKPGLFTVGEKINLFEAIYLAGGPSERADLTRVRRFSQDGAHQTEEVIDVQKYIDSGKMNGIPAVYEGDVIIVYNRWFDWKTTLTVLNNTLLFIVTIQAFAGIFK